jgi:nucleotide-binding universal stress UspA family protein
MIGDMKTILVPVDFSAATSRVCAAACDLARLMKGRVVLLHVVAPPPVIMNDYYAFDTGHMAQAMAAVGKSATLKLGALARRLGRRCPVQSLQVTGQPVGAILAKASALKAAYVVLGSHGHGAMFDLIVGSTAHGILRKARCPVLVVPMGRR